MKIDSPFFFFLALGSAILNTLDAQNFINLWDKRFGGDDDEDYLNSMQQTGDGGYLIGVASYSGISRDKTENNLGEEQVWIVKTNSAGIKQWDNTIQTLNGHERTGIVTEAGTGCYAAATATPAGAGGDKTQASWGDLDYWVIKFCEPPSADFTPGDTFICANDCISFTDLSSGAADAWQWSFSGAIPSSSTLQNPQNICYPAAGNYDVTLIVFGGGASDTITKSISVFPLPLADAGADTTIIQTGVAQLNGSGAGIYSWSPSAGLSCTDCANPLAGPDSTTVYYLTVTDSNGCSSADSVTVFVIPLEKVCEDIFIPNAFTPDKSGPEENEHFRAYSPCIETIRIRIFNRWGNLVFETDVLNTGWDGKYEGNDQPQGVYVYAVTGKLKNGKPVSRQGIVTIIR